MMSVLRRTTVVALSGLACIGMSSAAGAQESAYAVVSRYRAIDCSQGPVNSSTSATATASCTPYGNTGTASATGTATAATRTTSASAGVNTSSDGYYSPWASGTSSSAGTITYSGSNTPAYLVFTYAIAHSESAAGPAFSWGDSQIQLLDFMTNPNANWRTDSNGTTSSYASDNVWTDGTTVTFTMPFTGGVFSYETSVQADGAINNYNTGGVANGQGAGSITTTLTGVTMTDANGGFLGSAMFDESGNGVVADPVTTTPEPSEAALLSTGLMTLVPLIRRRTRR